MSELEGVGGMEAAPEREGAAVDDSGEPIGPFPTWKALYVTVVVCHILVIVLLYVFTVTLDRGPT